mmetsp:Transcript_25153/g.79372  ORF Transcript_25153/g.79372 Transcript_25153/m.79372 type:complete len:372 (-) Transcript_25153:11-1126(-)
MSCGGGMAHGIRDRKNCSSGFVCERSCIRSARGTTNLPGSRTSRIWLGSGPSGSAIAAARASAGSWAGSSSEKSAGSASANSLCSCAPTKYSAWRTAAQSAARASVSVSQLANRPSRASAVLTSQAHNAGRSFHRGACLVTYSRSSVPSVAPASASLSGCAAPPSASSHAFMASRAACAPGATLRTSIGSRPGKRSSARQSCTSAASMAPAGTTSCSSNLRPGPKSAQAADEAPPDSILIAMASDMAYCGYSGREWAGRAPGKARSQRVDPAMSARKSRCSNRWKGSASGSSEKMSRPNSSAVRWQPQRVDDCICRKSARRKGRLHSCDQRRRAVPPRRRERICGWKADSHTCSALAMHSEANSCCPVCPQ